MLYQFSAINCVASRLTEVGMHGSSLGGCSYLYPCWKRKLSFVQYTHWVSIEN